tara:strand:+ start:107 stop:346 length:240 start_codon:yes stop_codon:yes gene_type:complete
MGRGMVILLINKLSQQHLCHKNFITICSCRKERERRKEEEKKKGTGDLQEKVSLTQSYQDIWAEPGGELRECIRRYRRH